MIDDDDDDNDDNENDCGGSGDNDNNNDNLPLYNSVFVYNTRKGKSHHMQTKYSRNSVNGHSQLHLWSG